MRLAVISDIHGNRFALEAVLGEIEKIGVEQIICLGDVVDPLPGSQGVLEKLLAMKIPMIRGNHEDYVLTAMETPDDPVALAPNWGPVQVLAKSFDRALALKMKQLPLSIPFPGQGKANDILFCHASPNSNRTGWRYGISEDLARELETLKESVIVCGHWHWPNIQNWRGKTLIANGSVGIPFTGKVGGKIEAQFLILESTSKGWLARHMQVPYDHEATLKEYRDSGWVIAGGPSAWILYEELRTSERRMVPFLNWLKDHPQPTGTVAEFAQAVQKFMREIGSWDLLEPLTY